MNLKRAFFSTVAVALLGVAYATAQVLPQPGPPTPIACSYLATPPALVDGNAYWVQCGPGGTVPVVVAPYSYTPLTPMQNTLGIVASTALTIPTGSTYAVVCASGANVKYTTDGTTIPTSVVGMPLPSGSCIALSGGTVLSNFRAIQVSATATLDVSYFK